MNWTTINRMRVPEERKARRRCAKALKEQLRPYIADVKSATTMEGIARAARVKVDPVPMESALVDTYVQVGVKFAKFTRKTLKSTKADDPAFNQFASRMSIYAKTKAGKRITSINSFTQEEIERITGDAIEMAVSEGWGTYEASEYISTKLTNSVFYRAERIARTEVLTASNEGSLAGAESLGVPFTKLWIATSDNRTRDSHRALNGHKAGDNGRFSNGLEYPGDPNAPADEVVNCRCAIGYDVDGQEGKEDFFEPQPDPDVFVPAKTMEEAKKFTKDVIGVENDLAKLDLNARNEVNKHLHRLTKEYGPRIYELGVQRKANVYASASSDTMSFNNSFFNNPEHLKKAFSEDVAGKYHPVNSDIDPYKSLIDHEFAHILTSKEIHLMNTPLAHELMEVRSEYKKWMFTETIMRRTNVMESHDFISVYANKNLHEFTAEAFSSYLCGNTSNPWCKKVFDLVNKYKKI